MDYMNGGHYLILIIIKYTKKEEWYTHKQYIHLYKKIKLWKVKKD